MGDEEMQKQEEVDEYQKYKNFYENTPEEVRFFVDRIGMPCRAVRRDLKEFVGVLLGATYKLENVEIGVEEESKEYTRGVKVFERKVVTIPWSNLADFEFLLERHEEPIEEE